MASTIAFIDQLQGANYSTLSSTNFEVGIVDPDSSGLTSPQISSLESSGKTLLAYLSIGLANNYRSYWQPSWNSSPPSFILGAAKVIAHRPGICVHSAELLRQLDSGEEAGVAAANMSQPMDDSAA
jgi:hypothetical protein